MPLPTPLNIDQSAPDFSFEQNGETVRFSEIGSYALVYFYPKDDTPGCTKEACAIRDTWDDFKQAGIQVIGVSKDSALSHDKFTQKYSLPFPLYSDEDLALSIAFGVYGEKKFMGRVFDGIHRMSFLIDPSGKIVKAYTKVKPKDHASEVLEDFKKLKSNL